VYESEVYTPTAYPKFVRGSMDGLPSGSTNGMLAIGESVRRARWRAGLTQRHLGKLCGLDQSIISRLENGKLANLRWWRFAAVVGALGDAWDPASQRPPGGWW
jgi:DNA-binding XRE family transcriptional regulator